MPLCASRSDRASNRPATEGIPHMTAIHALDIYAGAGGLSIGLEAAGFKIVAGVDIDRDSCDTFAKAHPAAEVVHRDVGLVSFKQWKGAVDCVVGGPPCQPWSTGGKRLGIDDPRDGWPQFLQALEDIEPRAFIAENVAGLVTGVRRPYFQSLIKRLEEDLHFKVAAQVVNAADYGVPQKRLRLIIVGLRGKRFEFPTPGYGPGEKPRKHAGSVIQSVPIGVPNPSIVTYARQPDLRPNPYDGHIYNGGGRPIDLDKPAPTLLASMGGNKTPWIDTLGIVPEYHKHLMSGGEPRVGRVPGARRITVEEAALLQTFRPSMQFVGRRSSCYRQIGNAVPPLLAKVIGSKVLEQLV